MSGLVILFIVLAVLAVTFGRPTRVTCIGDSITSGGGCLPQSYTTNLQDLLGTAYTVTNAGVSAMTQLKKGQCNGGGDCSYWHTDAWASVQESLPDIVTIMLGTNDAKAFNWEGVQQNTGDYFALDYVDMINRVRSLDSKPSIYLMVPPPLSAPFPWEMNATVINTIYPSLIRDIAAVTNCQVIDVYSAIRASVSTNLTCDGCHPTAEGNEIIAQTVAVAIKSSSRRVKKDAMV